ncbi:hypothetical protein BVRB_5g120780 [Beta vulgaris subsp. vulgaris]|nr:hypothetical protein BVRB_5g120780 [Beta vulgaris subsp. vulgaris]
MVEKYKKLWFSLFHSFRSGIFVQLVVVGFCSVGCIIAASVSELHRRLQASPPLLYQATNENLPQNLIKQLAKELKNLDETPPEGIKVGVNDDDFTTIFADIDGPGLFEFDRVTLERLKIEDLYIEEEMISF